MWCKWLLRVSFFLLLGIFGYISSAVATEYIYVGPNDGAWTTQTNWSPLPTSPYTFPYGELNSAWINGDPGTNVNVYLNYNVALNGLKVDAGDSLTFVSIAGFALIGIDPYVMNNGVITFKKITVGEGLTATFSGAGTLNLATESHVDGGTCINEAGHTIRGAGWINANFENRGLIIADGGELAIERYPIHQSATGTLTTAGPGNILTLSYYLNLYGGRVYPNGGQVAFKGVYVFDGTNFGPGDVNVMTGSFNGEITTAADIRITGGGILSLDDGCLITNTGTISVESNGVNRLRAFRGNAVFTGTGRIVLGGTDSRLSQEGGVYFGNDVNHTIRGYGTIDAPVQNAGTVTAANGTLIINQPIMWAPPPNDPGRIEVRSNGTLDVRNNIQSGTLGMSSTGMLVVGNIKEIDLKRDFIFGQQNAAYWSWGAGSVLKMSGSGAQQQLLEVGGRDYGLSAVGFSNNFNLPALTLVNSGTYVNLVDNYDNGHRSSPEALYVNTLSVPAGTTLNLNRLHLYTYVGPNVHRVVAGEGNLFGGGQIIDVPLNRNPLPGIIFQLLLD